MKTNKNAVVKVNPKWRLDEETIALVKEARVELGLQGACDVVALWAKQWKEYNTLIGSAKAVEEPIMLKQQQESPVVSVTKQPEREAVEDVAMSLLGVPMAAPQIKTLSEDKPLAQRVETPYQVERRRKLEELRAKLDGQELTANLGAQGGLEQKMAGEPVVVPFDVLVNGERHRVIEYKGRRVLEWVGPSSTVMKKNLSPQEVVIYWGQRVVKP